MYCLKCGKQISDEALFCKFCGTKIENLTVTENKESTESTEATVVETQNSVNAETSDTISAESSIVSKEDSYITNGAEIGQQNILSDTGDNIVASDDHFTPNTENSINGIILSEPKLKIYAPHNIYIGFLISFVLVAIIGAIINADFGTCIILLVLIAGIFGSIIQLIINKVCWKKTKAIIDRINVMRFALVNAIDDNKLAMLRKKHKVIQQDGKIFVFRGPRRYYVGVNTDNTFSILFNDEKLASKTDKIKDIIKDYGIIAYDIQQVCGVSGLSKKSNMAEPNESRFMRKDYIGLAVETIICVSFIVFMVSRWSVVDYTKAIKETVTQGYPDSKYEELDKFCDNAKWKQYKDESVHVSFRGDCKFYGYDSAKELYIDWVIEDVGNGQIMFYIDEFKYDGNNVSNDERISFLNEIFGDGSLVKKDTDEIEEKVADLPAANIPDPTPTPSPTEIPQNTNDNNMVSSVDFTPWNGEYEGGWLDTILTFVITDDLVKGNSCGYVSTDFRKNMMYGTLYYIEDNQFYAEFEREDGLKEEYYICTESMNDQPCLDIYSKDGEYETTFSMCGWYDENYSAEEILDTEYILPDSNKRYLSEEELYGMTADECRIARNEIYARYGRRFNDEALQAHFDSCSWYYGTIAPDKFDESILNDYEKANRDLIVQYEKDMGYR